MRAILPAILAIFAAAATAHETWLLPQSFSVEAGEEIRLDLTSGMAFPALDSPIREERVARAGARIGAKDIAIASLQTGQQSLVLRTTPNENGLAMVWLELHPRDIELTDEQVEEYLAEIHAPEAVRSAWAEMKGGLPWKEVYTKHAKTFVAVGQGGPDEAWRSAIGGAFELVPGIDPRRVRSGSELPAQLLVHSAPLAGHPVGFVVEGGAGPVFRTTDAEGRVTFPVTRAGRAMLFTVRLERSADGKTWETGFATMCVEVSPH